MSKQMKGLGKGLDAIFQNSGVSPVAGRTPIRTNDSTIKEIELRKIKPNPNQPRTLFSDESIDELAVSIGRLGIIQPITLREQGDSYLIISGERRYRASLKAGLSTIPAYIRKADDQELLEMALVENIQREDLNAIDIALSFNRLLKECDLTQEQLADRVGKKRSTVANYVRLLSLTAETQAALRENLISMGHARALASLTTPNDQIYALEIVIEKGYSVRDTEELVSKLTQENPQGAEAQTKSPKPTEFKTIGKELSQIFNQKVAISQSSRGVGKVTIKFETLEELEAIRAIITK